MRNLASFETSLKFKLPSFENAARYPNSETKVQCCDDRPMSRPSLVKLGPRTLESVLTHPLKLHAKTKRAISSITQPWIIRFRSDFVQSLNA